MNVLPNYVKIPREIIYNTDIPEKRVIIFAYLCARRSLDDTVAFSTTELCNWSNLKPNYRQGKINQKYYEILLKLSELNYFKEYPDFNTLLFESTNSMKYHKVLLNIEKFDTPEGFGIIYFDELEKIINFKSILADTGINTERMSSSYILLLLAYLRVNIRKDKNSPLCCYRLYKQISNDIGLSERYISRAVDILDKLRIIKCHEMERISYIDSSGKNKFVTNLKVFANYRHFKKDVYGNMLLDQDYNPNTEIKNQIIKLNNKN